MEEGNITIGDKVDVLDAGRLILSNVLLEDITTNPMNWKTKYRLRGEMSFTGSVWIVAVWEIKSSPTIVVRHHNLIIKRSEKMNKEEALDELKKQIKYIPLKNLGLDYERVVDWLYDNGYRITKKPEPPKSKFMKEWRGVKSRSELISDESEQPKIILTAAKCIDGKVQYLIALPIIGTLKFIALESVRCVVSIRRDQSSSPCRAQQVYVRCL